MVEQRQIFTKGINRRFPREEATDPHFFYTLQNARILTRGETGKIIRIPGYSKFNSSTTDYTKVLDSIKFDDNYIVLYEDAVTTGTFYVEIFDNAGATVNSFSYTGDSTGTGGLKRADETVFIAPHNKVLYYDGSWSLQDFKVSIPTIASTTQNNAGKATATIEPTSSPTQKAGKKAKASIRVVTNNVPYGESDEVQISVGSNTTNDVTIDYTDNNADIAQKFYDALKADSGISGDWDISMSKEEADVKKNSNMIYFTASSIGTARNNDHIQILSNFVITTNERGSYSPPKPQVFGDPFNDPIGDFDSSIKESTAVRISQPSGGLGGSSDIGPLFLRLRNISHTVETENLLTSDTIADVSTKIFNALDGDSKVKEHFTVSHPSNQIKLAALEEGKKYNGEIALRLHNPEFTKVDSIFSYTKSDFSGGEEVDVNLSLDPDTNYWYKVRYKYIDGQVSPTSYPVKINTGPSKGVDITINTDAKDLDGSRPKVQIFRRKEGGDFFLVDEVTPLTTTHTFTDDGAFEQDILEEADTVWPKLHEAHEIIENRYVRANITYPTEEYTGVDFVVNTTTGNNETLPNNAKVRVFVQPQYTDGTKGYFEEIGVKDIKSPDQVIQITQQNTTISNSDKDIKELGFFANYKSHAEKHTYEFSTFEVANKNIPTIEDNARFPSRTRILFGYRYLRLIANPADDTLNARVYSWDTSGTEEEHYGSIVDVQEINSGPISTSTGNRLPRTLTVDVLGRETEYVRIAVKIDGDTPYGIYELADIEALKSAAEIGDLKIRMKSTTLDTLSSIRANDEIIGQEYNITGLIDRSEGVSAVSIQSEDHRMLTTPPDVRLYLEVEESALDDIDNENITSYGHKHNYIKEFITTDITDFNHYIARDISDVSDANDSYKVTFELTNFKSVNTATFKPYLGDQNANDGGKKKTTKFNETYYGYNWDYAEYELLTDISIANDNVVVFIGKKDNALNTKTFNVTGFDYREENSLYINRLRKDAFYHNLVLKGSLKLDKNVLENQLIWSGELNLGTGFSGGRNSRNESFYHISNENGSIIDVVSLGNKLFVFCEEGIAQINIGEVLTTQRSGEVYVDSSRFMTDYYWVNDKLINVKKDSIKKYKNTIYFTDGYDVYSLSGQGFNNITNGVLDLDPSLDYYGAINPKYDEYQLCDYSNTETWVFNTVFQQWYGPFTYKYKSAVYNSLEFITIDDSLYQHDIGNTFAGTAYTTKIENAADDSEASFYDKNFRKFYIGLNGNTNTTFKYGKDLNALVSITVSNIKEKNGYKHQGIRPDQNNNKSIFWTIESTNTNFELSDISWRFGVNRRR